MPLKYTYCTVFRIDYKNVALEFKAQFAQIASFEGKKVATT